MGGARSARVAVAAIAGALLGVAPGIAAGAVVSTGHSGWAWSDPAPQGESLTDLAFTGSTGYAVGGFGTLLRSTDGGATRTGLSSRTTQDLTRIGAVGATGFVTSGGCAVRRSSDAWHDAQPHRRGRRGHGVRHDGPGRRPSPTPPAG